MAALAFRLFGGSSTNSSSAPQPAATKPTPTPKPTPAPTKSTPTLSLGVAKSAPRTSQILPSVKCSECNQAVALEALGDHVCSKTGTTAGEKKTNSFVNRGATAPLTKEKPRPRSPKKGQGPQQRPPPSPLKESYTAPNSKPPPPPVTSAPPPPAPPPVVAAPPPKPVTPVEPPQPVVPVQSVAPLQPVKSRPLKAPTPPPQAPIQRAPSIPRPLSNPRRTPEPPVRAPSTGPSPTPSQLTRGPSSTSSHSSRHKSNSETPYFTDLSSPQDPQRPMIEPLSPDPGRMAANMLSLHGFPVPDTKVGGDAGMAGVGRRGFAAAAQAALFAQLTPPQGGGPPSRLGTPSFYGPGPQRTPSPNLPFPHRVPSTHLHNGPPRVNSPQINPYMQPNPASGSSNPYLAPNEQGRGPPQRVTSPPATGLQQPNLDRHASRRSRRTSGSRSPSPSRYSRSPSRSPSPSRQRRPSTKSAHGRDGNRASRSSRNSDASSSYTSSSLGNNGRQPVSNLRIPLSRQPSSSSSGPSPTHTSPTSGGLSPVTESEFGSDAKLPFFEKLKAKVAAEPGPKPSPVRKDTESTNSDTELAYISYDRAPTPPPAKDILPPPSRPDDSNTIPFPTPPTNTTRAGRRAGGSSVSSGTSSSSSTSSYNSINTSKPSFGLTVVATADGSRNPPSSNPNNTTRGLLGGNLFNNQERSLDPLAESPTSSPSPTSTTFGGKKRTVRTCVNCRKQISDGKWISVDGAGGVMCEEDWKMMYLPKCRRCDLPIESHAVSSSDGQLKGKYHRACFNCHQCHKPFPDKSFYVFSGRPYCEFHYAEVNGSLCCAPTCREPIEGPCAVADDGSRYHPHHFLCDWDGATSMFPDRGGRCTNALEDYWQYGEKRYCSERHAGWAEEEDDARADEERRKLLARVGGASVGFADEVKKEGRDSATTGKAQKRKTVFIDLGDRSLL